MVYVRNCKNAEDMFYTQRWWDNNWILPDDKMKLFLAIPLALFGCVTVVGVVPSMLMFFVWLRFKRNHRNAVYEREVLRWMDQTPNEFVRLFTVYNCNPVEHGFNTHGNEDLNNMFNALAKVKGVMSV